MREFRLLLGSRKVVIAEIDELDLALGGNRDFRADRCGGQVEIVAVVVTVVVVEVEGGTFLSHQVLTGRRRAVIAV